jgi:hypothetical protein
VLTELGSGMIRIRTISEWMGTCCMGRSSTGRDAREIVRHSVAYKSQEAQGGCALGPPLRGGRIYADMRRRIEPARPRRPVPSSAMLDGSGVAAVVVAEKVKFEKLVNDRVPLEVPVGPMLL